MGPMISLILLAVLSWIGHSNALVCFESKFDPEGYKTGAVKTTQCDDCKFCEMVLGDNSECDPQAPDYEQCKEPSVFPMHGDDAGSNTTRVYQSVFSNLKDGNPQGKIDSSHISYAILSFCIMEEYQIGAIFPQFTFRCFCNFDYCNRASTFDGYLDNLASLSLKSWQKRAGDAIHS